MIVVDSSALIAIFEHESDAALFAAAIQKADRLLVSAVNVHETGIVLRARHGVAAANRMWRFLQVENDFEIIPFDETQAREALAAFDRYGKGIDPKARLRLRARQDHKFPVAIQRRRFHTYRRHGRYLMFLSSLSRKISRA